MVLVIITPSMDKLFKEVSAEIPKQLTDIPTKLKLLGGASRPNSWTFLAEFSDGSKKVIKVIKPNKRNTALDEAAEEEALKRINHRTDIEVVKLLDKGILKLKNRNLPYLIFSYVKGQDLDDLVKKNSFSEKEVLEFIKSCTKTLIQLAEEGIVHQDIKPGNIKLTPKGDYVILDLGIARFIERDYHLNKLQGPAKYLSPEQINLGLENTPPNQRKITFLSDLYSLGVVAVELLTGRKFSDVWKNGERHLASERLRKGELLKISSAGLRNRIADYLEISPSTRLIHLEQEGSHNTSFIKDGKPGLAAFWILHHWTTGTEIISRFALENKDIKAGVILSSEHIDSVSNNKELAATLTSLGWKIAVDPATYKIPFLPDHHAKLTERSYFSPTFNRNHLYNSQFKERFVRDALDFQRQFNPDLLIAPYFFIEDEKDDFMELNFSLYEEAKRQFKENGESTSRLLLGLAISHSLICDKKKLSALLDQLILYEEADAYYIRPELLKDDTSPCEDPNYLKGLMYLAESLTISKSVLLSRVDQSALGLFTNTKLSIAINPDCAIRKQDIKDKLSKEPRKGGPQKENIKTHYYIPALLNDIELHREFNTPDFQKSLGKEILCSCSYCMRQENGVDPKNDAKKRNLHFTLAFWKQVDQIRKTPVRSRTKLLNEMITGADRLYSKLTSDGIILSDESDGSFLRVWKSAFIKS